MTETDDNRSNIKSREGGPVYNMIVDTGATHVAFIAWVVTAAAYGYIAATYQGVGVEGAQYPEYSGLFLVFGFALGVALSASFVAADGAEDDDTDESKRTPVTMQDRRESADGILTGGGDG